MTKVTNHIVHSLARKEVEALVDHIMTEHDPEDRKKTLTRLSYLLEHLFGDLFEKESFEDARRLIAEDGKWMHFVNKALDTLNPNIVKTAVMDLGFESGFYGLRARNAAKEKYHCNIPWAILFDPTSACNMHCVGCWAAEYGHTLNLPYDTMNKIVTEGKELGCHFYLMTGGEPLVRKHDIIRLCREHPDCEFHAFTNGTLIDEDFCKEVTEVGNLSFSISIEGFREVNDSRRGKGDFDKVMHAMDLLREHGIVFGTSICYTSKNIATVTSDKFLDMLIDKGAWFTWYFHYMPVGNDASLDLLPTPEQRAYMVHRVREIRSVKGGKPIFAMDFQNDGQFIDGCVAGARILPHQPERRCRAVCLHPLFECQHQGQEPARMPAAAAFPRISAETAVQHEPSAPLPDARKPAVPRCYGRKERCQIHRPPVAGIGPPPLRKMSGLRQSMAA